MAQLIWHTESRKVNDLIPFEQNPRKMTEQQVEALKASITKFNVVELPAIDTDNKIVAGHQRCKVLQLLGRGEETIDVRVPNRKLTDNEFKEYNVRSNKNTGMWDFELLAGLFEVNELIDIGFTENELDMGGFGDDSLKDDKYTDKIATPIYEVNNEVADVSELCGLEKYEALVDEINKAQLDSKITNFLLLAASRHIVFDYSKIADYYAHQSPQVQGLMEKSALVIVDFNKAIEEGFVQLKEELIAEYQNEYGE